MYIKLAPWAQWITFFSAMRRSESTVPEEVLTLGIRHSETNWITVSRSEYHSEELGFEELVIRSHSRTPWPIEWCANYIESVL